jgi:hypothetical protein
LEPLASYLDNDHLIPAPLFLSPFSFSLWPSACDKDSILEPCVHIPHKVPFLMLVCGILFICLYIFILISSFLRPFRVVGEAVDFIPMSLNISFFLSSLVITYRQVLLE